jgi:hypothetical protein
MPKRKAPQKPAVRKAEGTHGDKTHKRLTEQLESGARRVEAAHDPDEAVKPGRHRLLEGREQHDDADKHSDKNRLDIEIERRDLDRRDFQVRGGHHPERLGGQGPG